MRKIVTVIIIIFLYSTISWPVVPELDEAYTRITQTADYEHTVVLVDLNMLVQFDPLLEQVQCEYVLCKQLKKSDISKEQRQRLFNKIMKVRMAALHLVDTDIPAHLNKLRQTKAHVFGVFDMEPAVASFIIPRLQELGIHFSTSTHIGACERTDKCMFYRDGIFFTQQLKGFEAFIKKVCECMYILPRVFIVISTPENNKES